MRIFSRIAVWVFIACGPAQKAQATEELDVTIQQLVTQIATAQSAKDASAAYSKLFRKDQDKGTLRRLKSIPQDGVALRAAWEEMLHNPKFINDTSRPDAQLAVARFLGFVEGRTGIVLPTWWEDAVQNVFLGGDGRIAPGRPKSPYHDVAFREVIIAMPEGQRVQENKGTVALRSNDDSVSVSAEVVKNYIQDASHLSLLLDTDYCFIACHNTTGHSYDFVCVDRKSGNALWKSPIWDWANQFGATGSWYEYVALIGKGERLFVVGTGVHNVYIEAFERKTGKNIFRFSNNYFPEQRIDK